MCAYTYEYTCVYVCVYVCARMYMYECVHMYVCTYVYVCIRVCQPLVEAQRHCCQSLDGN